MSDLGSPLARARSLSGRLGARLVLTLLGGMPFAVGRAAAEPPPPLRFLPVAGFDGEGDSIASGVRISRLADGSVRVARERFEAGGAPRGVPVPEGLGGGYLFYQPIGSSGGAGTALFRAPDWTGSLRPLGAAPFVVSGVRSGFDRFYLLGAGRAMAIDPETGGYLPLDPLPPVATILDLAFDGAGNASVRAPIVGTLSTSDAGLGWRQTADVGDGSPPEDDHFGLSHLPRQKQLLAQVVLRGAALPGGVVVALVEGARVSLVPEKGALTRSSEPDLDPRARCQALPPGELLSPGESALLWFACHDGSGPLELRGYGLTPGAGPETSPAGRLVLRHRELFPARASILAAGRRGVLLEGPCSEKEPRGASRVACLVSGAGLLPLALPRAKRAPSPETFAVGSKSVSRLSLLSDGGIQSEPIDPPGEPRVHRIHHEDEIEQLVFGGTWLPGATVFEEGISFWATRGESYVGVRLELDDTSARVGAIQRPLRRAFLSGKHALAWGASGFARISVDSGMTFSEVNYPFVSGDQDPSGLVSTGQALELGCGPAGCSLGTWVSVGWGPPVQTEIDETPPRIVVPPLGGGRFFFACSPSGGYSGLALAGQNYTYTPKGDDAATTSVPGFWERAPPRPSPLEVAFSVGDHRGLARLYAVGPKEGAWGARGKVTVVFRSPFAEKQHFESLVESDLFADGADVQTGLGISDRMTQTVQTELDPGGEGGVMLIRTRQQTTLLTFAHRGNVQRFDVPDELGITTLSGVVMERGRFTIGQSVGGEFRILELKDGRPVLLAAFPLGESGPRDALLTRSTAFDLGIAIDGDLGLLIYPVSAKGELGDALFQPFRGSRPPMCTTSAGYLVVRELSIAPYVEVQGDELDVSRFAMRRIVGFGPECIDALAADMDGALEPRLLRAGVATPGDTPLVVTDRSQTGRRARLTCH